MEDSSIALIDKDEQGSGTKISRFFAARGVLIMKELRDTGIIKAQYGAKVDVSTLVLSTGTGVRSNKSYGVSIKLIKDNGHTAGAGFLDFDEIQEFIDAIIFIGDLSRQIANEARDYTEIIYSSKDDIQVGFYHTLQKEQQAFMKMGRSDTTFLLMDRLKAIGDLLASAKTFLISKGAEE